MLLHEFFLVIFYHNKNFKELKWAWFKILDHIQSLTEVAAYAAMFFENSFTFNNTQNILLNTVPLRSSWVQTVHIGYQVDFRKIRHAKQIKFTQLCDRC